MTKKARFIKRIDALSSSEKDSVISFFSKYPNYENKIDWNNKNLHYSDFKKVFSLAKKSENSRKYRAKKHPQLLFENHNCKILCQTEEFLLVAPLDWECAVFFNSFKCGGEGAKWCIGDKKTPYHWYNYRKNNNLFFLVYFTKKHPVFGKKLLIQYNVTDIHFTLWLREDKDWECSNVFDLFSLLHRRRKINFFLRLIPAKIWYSHLFKKNEIISKEIGFCTSLFETINKEIPSVGKKLLKKIIYPNYLIEGKTLSRWLNTEVKKAIIPGGITSIGDLAFFFCKNLKAINIPDSVTSIESWAFFSCENLSSLNIPNGVTSIGEDAFDFCEKLESLRIPDSVTSIGKSAFCCCENLKTINIPNGITSIEAGTFAKCKNLKSINIPNSVTSIGKKAFYGCEKLESVNLPDNLTSIAISAFWKCKKIPKKIILNVISRIIMRIITKRIK